MSPALDWPALLRAGLQVLRLFPRDFWDLTPAELSLMLGLGDQSAPMGRARFLALAAAHPDTPATGA
ncbi:rcc01693 family protein [Rubellimicrobium arenae]|uniref:rcc01693 family protein n=1 Tax=Rubellimicrobium arenae TaxID=2817372 RepID=UPI001B311CBE|nr:rcc01693 family protein [Rubellimicrobium arenae]